MLNRLSLLWDATYEESFPPTKLLFNLGNKTGFQRISSKQYKITRIVTVNEEQSKTVKNHLLLLSYKGSNTKLISSVMTSQPG